MKENTHAALVAEEMERFEKEYITNGLGGLDINRGDVVPFAALKDFIREAMLKAARAAVEAGEVVDDDYVYDDKDEDCNEKEEICSSSYETLGEAEAGGKNSNNAERRRKLNKYFSDTV